MKKCILILVAFALSYSAWAQTYHNGVWYALYDDSEHTMNTQGDYETSLFAPTTGDLNVKWRYEWIDWLGAFAKIDTDVLESADGGSNTRQVGSLAENTDKNSNTTEHYSVSRNINWIKYNRSGLPTHKVIVYHQDIPLAKHILFASGTYGATTASHDFGTQDALSVSEPFSINLRSFLTAGDITVTSSDPDIFRLGSADNTEPLVFAVGANACASANGTAAQATQGMLANIANYAVPVYFMPQEGKEYAAVITLTDGTSTVKVNVSGIGRKLDQVITWEPETPILSSGAITPATASSGLPVAYTFDPENILAFENGAFTILSEGTVTVTASQTGNTVYNAAESLTRIITVNPAQTYFTYEAQICEGDAWSDENFDALTDGGTYYDTIPNVYGGDSIITLELTVHPVYGFDQNLTMYIGAEEKWQNTDLSIFPLGDTLLMAPYTTVHGCDSVYTLHLSVIPRPTTYGVDTINICEGDIAEYEGRTYESEANDTILLAQKNQLGGDSVVFLTVHVWSLTFVESELTMWINDTLVWQHFDLSTMPLGDTTLIAPYVSVHGCDSVYTLHLSVIPRPTTYGADTLDICEGSSAEYEGSIYDSPVNDTVLLAQKNQWGGDSIVFLTVNVWQLSYQESELTIDKGDTVVWQNIDLSLLPAGDTTLIASYVSIHGCDSVWTLRLTVVPRPVTYGTDTISLCAGEKAVYEGKTYKRPTTDSVRVSMPNQFGGDSIVVLVVQVFPAMHLTASKTIAEGDTVMWQDIDLSTFPIGDTILVAEYLSVHGCDSTYTLYLTVTENILTAIDHQEAHIGNEVHKILKNGVLFIRKGDDTYDLYGRKIE